MAGNAAQADRQKAVADIIACRNKALNEIQAEMDRLNKRLKELDAKVLQGGVLTDDEEKEKNGLLDGITKLVAMETHAVLFSVGMLDSSAQVKYLASQVESANKELADIKKSIEDLSNAIKQANDFLKNLASLLTTLTGLLKVLV